MPHYRHRFALKMISKLSALWPVVGVLGLRQSGKTTLMHNLYEINKVISLDDFAIREEALKSPNTFLGKLDTPIILDEIQKAPPLFDAIKLKVDQKRIPGSYFLTGSTSFSNKIGIRESLTGRIGLLELLPMTLAELHDHPFRPITVLSAPLKPHENTPFNSIQLGRAAVTGGMPIPAFLRDEEQRSLYWKSWLETTLFRDLALFFKRGFDPDFAFTILETMANILRNGKLPTLKDFANPARKTRAYLNAMEDIFLLRKIICHPQGIGKEVWLFRDSGLAAHLMGSVLGENCTLSLARHFIWNEIHAQAEYQGKRFAHVYYKSTQGSPIDFVIDNIPFRIVASASALSKQLQWEERPLIGAMKKLKTPFGYLIGPIDKAELPSKNGGIGILPWSAWS